MQKKVCIITPGTIASNPRVVKEATALSEAGYQVHLIYTRHVDYLVSTDEEILGRHPEWTYDHLDWGGADLTSKSIKYFSGLIKKAKNLTLRTGLYPESLAGYLINRFYHWQLKKAILCQADLYIAHYPDSIAIAATAAKSNRTRFAYDAEDYHRGEDLPKEVTTLISINEDRFLQGAAYITGASILIAKAYQMLYPEVRVVPLENMFPLKNQLPFLNIDSGPFKFFWFSQTIGPKRGLEEFISIIALCSVFPIQLTLLGNVSQSYKLYLKSLWSKAASKNGTLTFLHTVPEYEIFKIASNHHFGLCLEIPSVPNKDYCMSNKLYSYILSGNYLILSQTKAQNKFRESYPEAGISIELNNPEESARQVSKLMGDRDTLDKKRRHNYNLGRNSLNFDREKEILLKQVSTLWE